MLPIKLHLGHSVQSAGLSPTVVHRNGGGTTACRSSRAGRRTAVRGMYLLYMPHPRMFRSDIILQSLLNRVGRGFNAPAIPMKVSADLSI